MTLQCEWVHLMLSHEKKNKENRTRGAPMSLTMPILRKAVGGADPRKAQVIDVQNLDLIDLDALKLLDKAVCVTLNCSKNHIKGDLSSLVALKRTLKHLCVANNQLHKLDNLSGADGLVSLDASHNSIVQCQLGRLLHLTHLNLSHNMLSAASLSAGGLSKLVSLVSLDISHNPLKTLPATLCAFPKLQTLNLDHCELSALPALAAMANLRNLRLCGNNLELLESPCKGLLNLNKLYVSDNVNLRDLAALIASSPALVWVDCSGCAAGPDVKGRLETKQRVIVCEMASVADAIQGDQVDGKKEKPKKKKKKKKTKDAVIDSKGEVVAVSQQQD